MASNKSHHLPPARPRPVVYNTTLASVADAATWYCALVLVALVLLTSFGQTYNDQTTKSSYDQNDHQYNYDQYEVVTSERAEQVQVKLPCDEIYVVTEGETLHTISEKCGDPFIVEQNPHIHDPDDVFPGLVIKITPFSTPN